MKPDIARAKRELDKKLLARKLEREMRDAEKKEQVNHPAHYGGDTVYETVKVLEAWMTPEQFIGGLRFNSVKYLSRAGKKDAAVQDLEKEAWYINKEIEFRKKKGSA